MGIPILQELLHKVLVGSGGTLNFKVSHIYSQDIFESLPPPRLCCATQVTQLMAFCWLGTTKKSLNGHRTFFLVRGWGLGTRLKISLSHCHPLRIYTSHPTFGTTCVQSITSLKTANTQTTEDAWDQKRLPLKLQFCQVHRAYVQVYTCTVGISCSSYPHAWISNWFGLSISVYQLVSPVKKTVHS